MNTKNINIQDHIGYDAIIEDSMRTIIHKVLRKVEKQGLQGGHHFVITFSTRSSGVILPDSLRVKFPYEMTIIIQHQFSSLHVLENNFQIALSFGGKLEKLTIPYRAISSFSDPEVNFTLKFNAIDEEEIEEYEEDLEPENQDSIDLSSKVVSLDAFRKNREKNNF